MKKKHLKSLCLSTVCLLAVFLTVFSVTKDSAAEPNYGITNGSISLEDKTGNLTEQIKESVEPVKVLSNNNAALYIDSECGVILEDAVSGRKYSSAVESNLRSNFADTTGNMRSICSLSYLAADGTEQTMDAFTEAISRDQFSVNSDGKTVSINLMFGQAPENDTIPYAVEKSRFEDKVLDRLETDEAEFIGRMYTLYDAESAADYGQEDLLETVPMLKSKEFYIRNTVNGKVTKDKLESIFVKIGYSAEDIAKDNEISGYAGADVTPCFRFTLELSLTDESFVINIPGESISFFREYPLMTITPLKYLLSQSGESGGILIPSGCGAVSYFHSGARAGSYEASFYGEDDNRTQNGIKAEMDIYDDNISLPLYVMQTGKDQIIAVVESSAESAVFHLERLKNSVTAFAAFTVLQSDRSYISEKKSTVVFAQNSNGTDITVRYMLGQAKSDGRVDYSEIANKYREMLKKDGSLNGSSDKTPVLLEYVGAVACDTEWLGLIKKKGLLELTDFDEMRQITDNFADLGEIGALNIKISGWNDGGLFAAPPGKYAPLSILGGKSGLKALQKYLKNTAQAVYYETNHCYIYGESSGFKKSGLVRLIDNSIGLLNGFNSVDGIADENITGSYIVSPRVYAKITEQNITKGFSGVSAGRLAEVLNSDYNKKANVLRKDALKYVTDALKAYADAGIPVLSNGCNAYAAKYVSLIENMPDGPSVNSKLFDETVPFKQMVLHGSVAYTGTAVNAQTDHRKAILYAIETGAGISYVFTADADEKLAATDFSYLYYTDYDLYKNEARKNCLTVLNALKGLESKAIISHSKNGKLATAVYEDGTVICVNYAQEDADTVYGKVGALDYARFDP